MTEISIPKVVLAYIISSSIEATHTNNSISSAEILNKAKQICDAEYFSDKQVVNCYVQQKGTNFIVVTNLEGSGTYKVDTSYSQAFHIKADTRLTLFIQNKSKSFNVHKETIVYDTYTLLYYIPLE